MSQFSAISNSTNKEEEILRLPHSFNDLTAFKELEKNLLEQLKISYEKEKTINEDLLESLYFIYRNPLLEALNQIDKLDQKFQSITDSLNNIQLNQQDHLPTLIRTNSEPGRSVYQVKGSIGVYYYIFHNFSLCTCSSFKYNILNRHEFTYCKHMVLVKLLEAMNKLKIKQVKDSEFAEILKLIQ